MINATKKRHNKPEELKKARRAHEICVTTPAPTLVSARAGPAEQWGVALFDFVFSSALHAGYPTTKLVMIRQKVPRSNLINTKIKQPDRKTKIKNIKGT